MNWADSRFVWSSNTEIFRPTGVAEESSPRQLQLRLVTTNRGEFGRRFSWRLSQAYAAVQKCAPPSMGYKTQHRHRQIVRRQISQNEIEHDCESVVIGMRVGE